MGKHEKLIGSDEDINRIRPGAKIFVFGLLFVKGEPLDEQTIEMFGLARLGDRPDSTIQITGYVIWSMNCETIQKMLEQPWMERSGILVHGVTEVSLG